MVIEYIDDKVRFTLSSLSAVKTANGVLTKRHERRVVGAKLYIVYPRIAVHCPQYLVAVFDDIGIHVHFRAHLLDEKRISAL